MQTFRFSGPVREVVTGSSPRLICRRGAREGLTMGANNTEHRGAST